MTTIACELDPVTDSEATVGVEVTAGIDTHADTHTAAAVDSTGRALGTAGANHDRLRSEAAFAMLCGAAPIPASSGRTHRHRLNRGGDRDANCALWRITISRLRHDPRTQAYMTRRSTEGLSKTEIIRCLKRFIAREIYYVLNKPSAPLDTP